MAYPEGNFANLQAKRRARGEILPLRGAPPIAPQVSVVDPRVAALRQEYMAADTPVAPAQQAPQQLGFLEQLRGRYGSGAQQVDPRYTAQREQVMSELLRSVGEDEQPGAPRVQFSQPYTPQYVDERVNQLRNDQTIGTLFGMSGDRALGGVGAHLMKSDPTAFMQDVHKQKQVTDYQQWQADMASQPTRANKFDRLSKVIGLMDDGAATQQAATQAGYQNVPAKLPGTLSDTAKAVDTSEMMLSTFNPENQKVLGEYQSVLGNVPSWMVSQGLEGILAKAVSDGAPPEKLAQIQDSVMWWSNFKYFQEMPTRHEYFGAALTAPEQASWKQALLITPSTDPSIVKEKLEALHTMARKVAEYTLRVAAPIYGYDAVAPAFEGSAVEGAPLTGQGSYARQNPQQPTANAWQDPDFGGVEVR